ncbi:single-stranded DNA-binding protein [Streptomyces sp. T-3]|nr:single-stranded DNA-binding protein [Streptomyces sp. T-3]
MALSVRHVSGTVTGAVEVRFTGDGVAVCRFRVTETPTWWDRATQKWRDGTPIHYICTAWRDLATNAAESLVDGVHVLLMGRITEIKDNSVYLSLDDLGISLRKRIAYTEASLPSELASAPTTPHAPAPRVPAGAAATQPNGRTAQPQRGWAGFARTAAATDPAHFEIT